MKEIDGNKLMHLTAKIIGFAEAIVLVLEARSGEELNKKNRKILDDEIKEFNEITGCALQTYTELYGDIMSRVKKD